MRDLTVHDKVSGT